MPEKFKAAVKISLEDLQKDPTLLSSNKNEVEKQFKKTPTQKTTAPLSSKKPQVTRVPKNQATSLTKTKRETPLIKASIESYKDRPRPVKTPAVRGEDFRQESQEIPYTLSKQAEAYFNNKKYDSGEVFKDATLPFADDTTIEYISKNTEPGDVFEDDQFTYTVTEQKENGVFILEKVHKETGVHSRTMMKPETLADKLEQKKLTPMSEKKEFTPTQKDTPKSLEGILDWQNKKISITEDDRFATFVFADKKNPGNRDSIMIPIDQKERIEKLKSMVTVSQEREKGPDQEVQKNKTEDQSFTVGQSFKTKKGEEYIISKITRTLIYLSGKKEKIESIESLSQLIQEGTLIKVEGEILLSVGESFYDEKGTKFTIKEIKGALVVLTDGKNEDTELKKNVQEYLKSGAFTRVEKTTESLDEQVKALGWVDVDLTYFTEEMKQKVIAEQKRKPEEAKEAGPTITHPEILDKKLEKELGWNKEIIDVLTSKEKFKYAITDSTQYTHVLVEKADEFRKRIKDRKLEKIDNEITEIEKRRAERSLKITEMKKVLRAYYELNPKEKGDNSQKLTPIPPTDTKNEIKGAPEKISQPIELSIEDTSSIKTEEKLETEHESTPQEKTPALGEYITFEEIDKNNSPQDALKDIESTTQALEELRIKENHGVAFDILISQGVRYIQNFSSEIQLSRAYHKAKKGDTSWSLLNEGNTDNKALIKAVEDALTLNASS